MLYELYNTTGTYNTAIGYSTLAIIQQESYNTAIGLMLYKLIQQEHTTQQ
jgi:hypothetical protein